ncbi:MAG: aldo/keto reductase [Agathobacter sp.]|uniref:aldo/keto reductase n=1 Tax=Agathobacter sp. TaxID=2021311 RepID=UPI00258F66ED|nr:aldo/keto reductase [Agathobacter sp.]MCR5676524.1 aldo/keto reductase [Agathobacter sp.]
MHTMTDRILLNNRTAIPCLGFGTYKITDAKEAYQSVYDALSIGYRHIDTAAFYENEASVGAAIRDFMADHQVAREEIFVTSKVWKTEFGRERTKKAFAKSMELLGLDYLDLYLVHWPSSFAFDDDWENTNRDTWRGMIDNYRSGRVKAIGVSNFLPHHLHALMDMEVIPAVDQIEVNPGFLQEETLLFCKENKIVVEAWSPLGRGLSLKHPLLESLAQKYRRSVAQIILRWELQHDIIPLPKSVNPSRMKENAQIFDFSLSDADMAAIDALAPYGNSGHSPDQV